MPARARLGHRVRAGSPWTIVASIAGLSANAGERRSIAVRGRQDEVSVRVLTVGVDASN
jgi:hypothetical protein